MIGTVSDAARAPRDPDAPDPRHPRAAAHDAEPEPGADPWLPAPLADALALAGPGARAYARYGIRMETVAAVRARGRSAAWRSVHAGTHRPWIIATGPDPDDVAWCAAALVPGEPPIEGITILRGAFAALPGALRPVEHWDWDWWCTTQAPPARPGEASVVGLDPADPRIQALLDHASPGAHARPGDPLVLGWAGVTARAATRLAGAPVPVGAGEYLVAVAAVTTRRPGIPHLAAVATDPAWRGLGLARDVCAHLTRTQLAAGVPAVTLGTEAGNTAAAAVYRSLGFQIAQSWTSGRMPGTVAPGT